MCFFSFGENLWLDWLINCKPAIVVVHLVGISAICLGIAFLGIFVFAEFFNFVRDWRVSQCVFLSQNTVVGWLADRANYLITSRQAQPTIDNSPEENMVLVG